MSDFFLSEILFGYPNLQYVPFTIVAGDTTQWCVRFETITPAAGYSLSFVMAGPGTYTVAASPNNNDWLIKIVPTASSVLPAGIYAWAYKAALNGDVYTVKSGRVNVLADIAAANPGDFQTQAQKELALIQAAILAKISDGGEDFSMYGVSVKTISLKDLYAAQASAEYRVWQE